MKNLFKNIKEEGLSLRSVFFILLTISLIITIILFLTSFETIRTFRELSSATESYIIMQDAANSLMKASDYLTEQAQCYTVIGDRKHLENYFNEAEQVRRREKAIEVLEQEVPDSDALMSLKGAMKESLALMEREYYGMMLVLMAQNDDEVPEAMRGTFLREEDLALTAAEKMELARVMTHDEGYYTKKDMIRNHLNDCLNELKSDVFDIQTMIQHRMDRDLVQMIMLIVFQTSSFIFILVMTMKLGLNPLVQAVDHINRGQELPITGAHEFRYLARSYNKMYNAYRRSIDKLSFKASHDELTGVYNRAGYDLINKSVDLSTTAFLLCDGDNFKNVNDLYGHEIGDRVLKKIAKVLSRSFRSDDYVCRMGGDEFMVLMVHIHENMDVMIERKVEQINEALQDTRDGLPPVTVSVGVSLSGRDAQVRFREADKAMYYVKDHGGKGCQIYTPAQNEPYFASRSEKAVRGRRNRPSHGLTD